MTTYMPINHKKDEYILHNVAVHGGKNEEITCIHNILNHTNVIFV